MLAHLFKRSCLASALVILLASGTIATGHRYVERFATKQYCDQIQTTAVWDTVAGELRLHPFEPTLVGGCDTPGDAYGVAIAGDYAYVVEDGGFRVIDISNSVNPTLVGSYDMLSGATGVAIAGDYAYVAANYSGLLVINISNPMTPSLAGSYNTSGYARDVAIGGDYAYVSDYDGGLKVIDISNPTAPTLAGSCSTPGSAWRVAIAGDYAYVADEGWGLEVIDISDPTNPTLAGSCETPGIAVDVAIAGDYAYVADTYSALKVISISDPENPVLVGTYSWPGYGVTIAGDYAYIPDYSLGIQVVDISDPVNPSLAWRCDTPGLARGIAIDGNHAYVADGDSGLQVINISSPTNPLFLGGMGTYRAMGVAIDGDYAYVGDWNAGLEVINITDPAGPTLAGHYDTPGLSWHVAIAGDVVYVADYGSLLAINISNPANPTLAGGYYAVNNVKDVAIAGDYAYVADGGSGLLVLNISNPTSPTFAGRYDTPGDSWGVAVAGDYAYVADRTSGLVVINISNPTNPTLAGSCVLSDAIEVAVAGDYAYVAAQFSGLKVINISNPANPVLAGTCSSGQVCEVAIAGDYAYVASANSGIQAINISDPANPTFAGGYRMQWAAGIAVDGDCAYVADNAGLRVFQVCQRFVNGANNRGQSLALNQLNRDIVRARLSTVQSDSIRWEASADSGTTWQELLPGGEWTSLAPGSDLLWRSTHLYSQLIVNPTCTQLEVGWLYAHADIDSIRDIPNDQGGRVRVYFSRSGYDFTDEATHPITAYNVWRRVDNAIALREIEVAIGDGGSVLGTAENAFNGLPVFRVGDRVCLVSDRSLQAAGFPSGTWEVMGSFMATQQDQYIYPTLTLADSSSSLPYAVYCISAHTPTPSLWYVSPPDSGYSVDNIAPAVPEGFAIAYNTGSGNRLTWDPSPDEDFQYFRVYRSSDPDFVPSPSELVHSLTETNWSDPDYDGWNVYYKITALDYVGNESDPASAGTVTAVTGPVIPQAYGLYPNVPNPFNPSTTIRYDMPADGGAVTLRIYDVSGRLVRTLVDGPQAAGQKQVTWNGKDDLGRSVVSGVYFYRLEAPRYKKTLKMILIQ
jgi:hypothetical protein